MSARQREELAVASYCIAASAVDPPDDGGGVQMADLSVGGSGANGDMQKEYIVSAENVEVQKLKCH